VRGGERTTPLERPLLQLVVVKEVEEVCDHDSCGPVRASGAGCLGQPRALGVTQRIEWVRARVGDWLGVERTHRPPMWEVLCTDQRYPPHGGPAEELPVRLSQKAKPPAPCTGFGAAAGRAGRAARTRWPTPRHLSTRERGPRR
jgi:hypothetical protein